MWLRHQSWVKLQDPDYLPFIDGLRAIAIAAVVLYHAFPGLLPGGFAGVDLFFVISGFVITRSIGKEIVLGTFSLRIFFVRRARRLLPAAFACLALVVLLGYTILPPSAFRDLGSSVVASIFMYANFFYYQISGYFSPQVFELPLLHTWSLALEDQFYLTWPPLLLLALPHMPRHAVLAIVAGLIALSAAIAVQVVSTRPEWAFYLLPARAWELLVGCLVALLPLQAWRQMRPIAAEAMAIGGVLAIALSMLLLDANSRMPGLSAVPLCLGTAMVIASAVGHDTAVRRLVSFPALLFLGRISYSLYLVHWPLLSLASYRLDRQLTASEGIAVLIVGLLLATGSWRYIEQVFRTGRHTATSQRSFILAGASAAALLLALAVTMKAFGGWPWRYDDRLTKLFAEMHSSQDHAGRCDGTDRVIADDADCRLGRAKSPDASYDVALLGDSMAAQWEPLLAKVSEQADWAARQVTRGGCGFFPDLPMPPDDPKLRDCGRYAEEAMRFIDANPGLKLVIVSAFWQRWRSVFERRPLPKTRYRDNDLGSTYAGPTFAEAVRRMVKVLRDRGIKVHIIGAIPVMNFRMACVVKAARQDDGDFRRCGVAASEALASIKPIEAVFAEISSHDAGVTYSSPAGLICIAAGCSPVLDETFLYQRDGLHLNWRGAVLLSHYLRIPSQQQGAVHPSGTFTTP